MNVWLTLPPGLYETEPLADFEYPRKLYPLLVGMVDGIEVATVQVDPLDDLLFCTWLGTVPPPFA